MTSNYAAIIQQNLETLFSKDLDERGRAMDARHREGLLIMPAFARHCRYTREGIFLDDTAETGPVGIILSLYALHATEEAMQVEPFQSFKEIPDSMPYQGAFRNRTEMALVPAVARIPAKKSHILSRMNGSEAPAGTSGDFGFVVRPLPKIALCYLFYEADEDFPPSVTCLYSNNAHHFMPTDGLADVGEYTSKAILGLI
jgi:hypothetical protein